MEENAVAVEQEQLAPPGVDITPETTAQIEGAAPSDTPESDGAEHVETEVGEKRDGVQRRIDELTREKYEAQREAEYYRGQAEARAQQGQPQAQQPQSQPLPGLPPKPRVEDFDTYEAFSEALTDWKVDEREIKRELRTQAQQKISWFNQARGKFPDFDSVVMRPDLPMSHVMIEAIQDADNGHEIAYYLGKNPDVARQIAYMPALKAVKEIARLEADLKKPPPRIETRAPAPTSPTGGKSTLAKNPENMTQAEYEAWRRSQGA